ncbi:MAG TPA: pyridoxal phosphate-dependent aminotransferase [candidate division Zixibacteria bacterium]|nr:pyridoxal phosphate-dependent aminotransferase [candidate division Zixibacteria bacterium]MDD4918691.1 pyridoxal phosphate-dependent aminotransferase [candidate division Zixibacteria bacterium]MDM7973964.1 pyridoxal phosphate-dependent aminotransferase [candidate division Zixibacteria bacterium]HOD66988.1 pyridoxal phosphate-dependent aminotransferase [candidate division Zixibacteria bacterium]HOZ06731.1 pyridoxal phosphate-dependent aminotransferase [candidate division Zixibacteria bacteriu
MQYTERVRKLESEGAFVVLAKAKALERQGKSIIHLQIGEPDFDTPANVTEAGIKALRAGQTHYAPSGGVMEAREVCASYLARTRHIPVTAENTIIMPGAKPFLFCALIALINEGDEVIVPNPGYPTYRSIVKFVGAKPVPVRLREENDFRFSIDEFRSLITPRTRMVILNSPGNPTGGVLTWEDLEAIHAEAKKHDLWILSDEIYSRLVYDGEFKSIAMIPGAMERSIIVDGMSKTYAMTGWRLGFAAMPKELAQYFFTLAINNFSSTCTFAQYAMIEALTGPQDDVDKMVAEFRRRRTVIVDGLNAIDGVRCLNPEGAFYVFPNITGTGLTSQKFADVMLDEAGVACLSGTAFGEYGEGYVRFSYANSVENIREALARIKRVLAGVRTH